MIGTFLQTLGMNADRGVGQADVSALGFLAPILVFLFVVIIVGTLVYRSKIIGENAWLSLFIALAVGIIFIAIDSLRDLVLIVVPWFVALLVVLFLMLILGSAVSNDAFKASWFGWIFIALLGLVFIFAGIKVFANTIGSYVPGPFYGQGVDPQLFFFFEWFYSPPIIGSFWLIIAAIVVSWILIKFGK